MYNKINIYTTQIQRKFSRAPYKESFTILDYYKNNPCRSIGAPLLFLLTVLLKSNGEAI